MFVKNNYSKTDANGWRRKAGSLVADKDLGERVYTSRLIGLVPDLIMHGGGNTSVKVTRKNIFGKDEEILHVKGSGWNLDTIEAPGLPGVRLSPLREFRKLKKMTDEDMVNIQRNNLIDSGSPNPSVLL
jgi:rhamnose utilization protein RhaD (predicted bifunctional aldolase and dehydrogenase)